MKKSQKLTPENIQQIKQRIADGEKQQLIADDYDISQCTVSRIKNNHEWNWVESIDVTDRANYWSYQSSRFKDLIVSLYKDGYGEYQVADKVNQMIDNGELEPSRGKCDQRAVHMVLTREKVKIRFPKPRIPEWKVKEMISLRKKGWSYNKIADKLSVSPTSVEDYVKGNRKRK